MDDDPSMGNPGVRRRAICGEGACKPARSVASAGCAGGGNRRLFLFVLRGQITLVAHLADLVQLSFEKIHVLLLVLQQPDEEIA